MSSKRQQVRNERALQDLVKTVPGNNTCADCFARNPAWASWSLGIFLCMRCAGLHRKLGTHISKVKSLSMDSWTSEQVEFMKRTGNVASNRIYNPTNSKPNIPLDVDEVESAMERYIRQKYMDKDLNGTRVQSQRRHNTGSTESDEYHRPQSPPPLPTKTSSGRFGLKSASSMFSSRSKRRAEANAREVTRSPSPPMANNKPSRVFGSSVGESMSSTEDFHSKLRTLRDMGFLDEKRNATVLKGLNGNFEKSIESLVRLGEGTKPVLPPRPRTTSAKEPSGISFEKTPPLPQTKSHLQSNNPFDIPQPQSSQSTGTLMQPQHVYGSNPYQNPIRTNPFGPVPTQSQYDMNQAFQNLSVSNPSSPPQTLFPHRTGPSQNPHHQKFLPSLETSVQAVPQQYPSSAITPYSSMYDFQPQQQNAQGSHQQQMHNNPFLQQPQPSTNGNGNHASNPFLHHASTFPLAPQQPQPTNIFSQAQQQAQPQQQQQAQAQSYDSGGAQSQQQWSNQQTQAPNAVQNPFQQQAQAPNPTQNPYQQQPPANPVSNPYQQQPQAQNSTQNPYQQQSQAPNPMQNPYQQQSQAQQQYPYTPQPLVPQQTGRANKSDILALYNYPQLAPPVPQLPTQQPNHDPQPPNGQGQAYQQNGNGQQTQSYQQNGQTQQTNTAPAGSNNPFMSSNGGGGKQSRESIMVEGGGWMNGRHSPDAFANLSTVQTRSMR